MAYAPIAADRPVRWGILGCGNIAGTVAGAIRAVDGAVLAAVASRDPAKAEAFAGTAGARRWFGGYEALVASDEVDIVYVATPPSRHAADVALCLAAGKHVLCEKPFALTSAETRTMIDTARDRGLFLMEALWTRFLPSIGKLEALVRGGRIGTPRLLIAGGAFRPQYDPAYYLFDPALGGGVMRDAGIYLLHAAHWLLGAPETVLAAGHGDRGVDVQDAVLLRYPGGALGVLYVSMEAQQPPYLELLGDKGSLKLAPPVFNPSGLHYVGAGGESQSWSFKADASGYAHEIAEAVACLRAGRQQSERLSWADSLAVMTTLDKVMAQLP
ncbi:MAG TPA: Gfo/Idh/MocA family oxidoreductase [Sphingomonadaceae bacterium]|nr:Gfo/Idh/MocA family oxidoreductase [Sphingomonadaceae bacterium]